MSRRSKRVGAATAAAHLSGVISDYAARKRARQKNAEPATRWIPVAVTLVMEHYTCQCGSVFTAPSPHVMIRQRPEHDWVLPRTRYIRKSAIDDVQDVLDLPREMKEIHISLEACNHCFVIDDGIQMELFPKPNAHIRWLKAKEEKRLADTAARAKAGKRGSKLNGKKPLKTLWLEQF